MRQEREAFLDRWSRVKREQAQETPAAPLENAEKAEKEEPAVALPPVEELKADSDFVPFMNPKVDDATRRSALKKLFTTDAHFNVPDPFEAYSEDYTRSEPIPEAMLMAINKVRDLALNGPEQAAERQKPADAAPSEEVQGEVQAEAGKIEAPTQEPDDVAGRQDT